MTPASVRHLAFVVNDDQTQLILLAGLLRKEGLDVQTFSGAADALAARTGKQVAVFNARFIKPLPLAQLLELAKTHKRWLTVEENVLEGGFGSAVVEALSDAGALCGLMVKRLGLPDAFVEHGSQKALRALCGIDQPGIEAALAALLAS